MADIVDAATRSRMMSGIKGKNTQPEKLVRSALHVRGFRFSRALKLPGSPDAILPKWKVAVFVHGCFWHFHGCSLSKLPSSNAVFWSEKLQTNVRRDTESVAALLELGWRVATIWECAIRRRAAAERFGQSMDELAVWIRHDDDSKQFVISEARKA